MKQRFQLLPNQLVSGLWLDETISIDNFVYQKNTILDLEKIIQIQKYTDKPISVYIQTSYVRKNSNGTTVNVDINSMQNLDGLCRNCINNTIYRFYGKNQPVLQTSIMTELYTILLGKNGNMKAIKRILAADEYTCHHSINIATLCYIMNNIIGMPFIPQEIILAGLLHDIGKTAIPTEILNKNGKLDDTEWNIMKNHTINGVNIIRETIPDNKTIIDGILYHHERYDGTGYPYGVKGNNIPFIAQIINICDVFDAISTKRPYHEAISPEQTLQKMSRMEKEFNPDIWDIFKYIVERSTAIYPCTTSLPPHRIC